MDCLPCPDAKRCQIQAAAAECDRELEVPTPPARGRDSQRQHDAAKAGGAKRSLSQEFELAVLREDSSAQQGELLRAVEELRVCRERYAHAERQVFNLGRLLELTTGALRLAEEEVEARDNELETLRCEAYCRACTQCLLCNWRLAEYAQQALAASAPDAVARALLLLMAAQRAGWEGAKRELHGRLEVLQAQRSAALQSLWRLRRDLLDANPGMRTTKYKAAGAAHSHHFPTLPSMTVGSGEDASSGASVAVASAWLHQYSRHEDKKLQGTLVKDSPTKDRCHSAAEYCVSKVFKSELHLVPQGDARERKSKNRLGARLMTMLQYAPAIFCGSFMLYALK